MYTVMQHMQQLFVFNCHLFLLPLSLPSSPSHSLLLFSLIGLRTEGIFRVPGAKARIDEVCVLDNLCT